MGLICTLTSDAHKISSHTLSHHNQQSLYILYRLCRIAVDISFMLYLSSPPVDFQRATLLNLCLYSSLADKGITTKHVADSLSNQPGQNIASFRLLQTFFPIPEIKKVTTKRKTVEHLPAKLMDGKQKARQRMGDYKPTLRIVQQSMLQCSLLVSPYCSKIHKLN